MGMSEGIRILKDIEKTLRRIAIELVKMNKRAERKEVALFGTLGFSIGSPDIPESCPKERRWVEPAAAATCNTCRRFWSCPYPSPAQDPKGGK